ncbi:hypothetical protein RFI_30178, partial [Reticulomyxa filosa]
INLKTKNDVVTLLSKCSTFLSVHDLINASWIVYQCGQFELILKSLPDNNYSTIKSDSNSHALRLLDTKIEYVDIKANKKNTIRYRLFEINNKSMKKRLKQCQAYAMVKDVQLIQLLIYWKIDYLNEQKYDRSNLEEKKIENCENNQIDNAQYVDDSKSK